MRSRSLGWVVVMTATMLAGCGSKVPPIGPGSQYQPDEREQRMWQTAENDSRILQSNGILYQDPALQAYVNSVLDRLLKPDRGAYQPLTARVYVIDSPTVNAFAMPNGDIFVHSAILGRARSEAQLAMLLGHEIAHATHRHSFQEARDAYARSGTSSYVSVLSTVGGGNVARAASGLSALVTVAGINGYSRDKEREADEVGLMLIARAGYDPAEGSLLFKNMMDAADKKDLRYSALYSRHPKMKERVEDCASLAKGLPPDLLAGARTRAPTATCKRPDR